MVSLQSPLPSFKLSNVLVNLSIDLGKTKYPAANITAIVIPEIYPIFFSFLMNIIQNHAVDNVKITHNIPALDVMKNGIKVNAMIDNTLNVFIIFDLLMKSSDMLKANAIHDMIEK